MTRLGFVTLASGCMGPWPNPGAPTDGDEEEQGLEEVKAGFVYVGPVGDHGWSKSHDDGRLYVADALGIETTYEPSVSPADTVAVLDEMIADGVNVAFTTSFDFVSQTQQAAALHEDQTFLNCSGGVWAENLSSYMGRMYQPMYLAGIVAGRMTKTDHVAVLGAVPVPEVVRHVNAFTLGVRSVNPQARVEVSWIMNWFDVELEPQHTLAFVAHGADIILVQTDTTIAVEVSAGLTVTVGEETHPVYSIGYDNVDSCTHAPETCLTAPYWNWGPMYVDIVEQIREGTWDPSVIRWDQMRTDRAESVVALADFNALVPGEVRIAVDEAIPALTDPGNVAAPFIGPIRDTAGDLRVAAGDRLDDDALNRMCWHVEGVYNWEDGALVPATVPSGCPGDP
jgi:basic membrane protein A